MTDNPEILPSGFKDVLPPQADYEAAIINRLMKIFQHAGYSRVKPALMEFEIQEITQSTIRHDNRLKLMDPTSNHLLLIRNDFTTQIARIVRTALAHAKRPLRLSYQGDALCAQGSTLNPARQFSQVGIEHFSNSDKQQEREIILLALKAIECLAIENITIDVNMPPLTQALFDHFSIPLERAHELRDALNFKDKTAIKQLIPEHCQLFCQLIDAAGPIETSIARLEAMTLPASCRRHIRPFITTALSIAKQAPQVHVILDPLENRGFAYHNGVTFSYFCKQSTHELGRGGKYTADNDSLQVQRLPTGTHHTPQKRNIKNKHTGEQAVGCTLFIETLTECCPLTLTELE